MPYPLTPDDQRHSKQSNRNVDARLCAKSIDITRLVHPGDNTVEKPESDDVLCQSCQRIEQIMRVGKTYFQTDNESQGVRVDGQVAVGDVGHCHCWDGGEAHADHAVGEEAVNPNQCPLQSLFLNRKTYRAVQCILLATPYPQSKHPAGTIKPGMINK